MIRRLHTGTLQELAADVSTPTYDRENLGAGIVHLGLGAFHRAHQAVYTDEAIAQGGGDWGIVGVSLRSDTVARQLLPQACLYSVLSQDASDSEIRVIGSILDVLVAPESPGRVAEAIANSAIQIVTFTITEKGYCLASDGCSLDRRNPSIEADLQSPYSPVSAIGLVALGLRQRMASGGEPITLLSCDNLSENSKRLKGVLTEYMRLSFPDVIPWLSDNVAFPCSMVDRIVPAVTSEQKVVQADLLGVQDEGAVSTERFTQWIVEDCFAAGRPAWQQVGVEFVDDIVPFENMKLRVLNASHSAIAMCGLVAGLDTVDQVMADRRLAEYVVRLIDTELVTAIDAPPGFDLSVYRDQLLQRYRNPHLKHRCAQIAMDSSEKISQRWLPAFEFGLSTKHLIKALSLWCYCVLCTELELNDPHAEQLSLLRNSDKPMPMRVGQVLASARFQASALDEFEELTNQIARNLARLEKCGIREFLLPA